jgi:hypothetical protein
MDGPQEVISQRRRGQRSGMTGALHLLKRKFQKRFLAQQCKELTDCLADAIAATIEAAPVRVGKRYIQNRKSSRATRASEANWEEALFQQWKAPSAGTFAPWKQLLTYQVLLQTSKHDEDWGEIDRLRHFVLVWRLHPTRDAVFRGKGFTQTATRLSSFGASCRL